MSDSRIAKLEESIKIVVNQNHMLSQQLQQVFVAVQNMEFMMKSNQMMTSPMSAVSATPTMMTSMTPMSVGMPGMITPPAQPKLNDPILVEDEAESDEAEPEKYTNLKQLSAGKKQKLIKELLSFLALNPEPTTLEKRDWKDDLNLNTTVFNKLFKEAHQEFIQQQASLSETLQPRTRTGSTNSGREKSKSKPAQEKKYTQSKLQSNYSQKTKRQQVKETRDKVIKFLEKHDSPTRSQRVSLSKRLGVEFDILDEIIDEELDKRAMGSPEDSDSDSDEEINMAALHAKNKSNKKAKQARQANTKSSQNGPGGKPGESKTPPKPSSRTPSVEPPKGPLNAILGMKRGRKGFRNDNEPNSAATSPVSSGASGGASRGASGGNTGLPKVRRGRAGRGGKDAMSLDADSSPESSPNPKLSLSFNGKDKSSSSKPKPTLKPTPKSSSLPKRSVGRKGSTSASKKQKPAQKKRKKPALTDDDEDATDDDEATQVQISRKRRVKQNQAGKKNLPITGFLAELDEDIEPSFQENNSDTEDDEPLWKPRQLKDLRVTKEEKEAAIREDALALVKRMRKPKYNMLKRFEKHHGLTSREVQVAMKRARFDLLNSQSNHDESDDESDTEDQFSEFQDESSEADDILHAMSEQDSRATWGWCKVHPNSSKKEQEDFLVSRGGRILPQELENIMKKAAIDRAKLIPSNRSHQEILDDFLKNAEDDSQDDNSKNSPSKKRKLENAEAESASSSSSSK